MPIVVLLVCALVASVFAGESSADSATAAAVADSTAPFRVDKVRYHIGDAFDDSKYHTKYDKWAYDLLNVIHIETREATVRKLLLFNEGEIVDLNLMLESERFLRDQSFLSDASIEVNREGDSTFVDVHTSDNWTLTLPFSLGFSGSEWSYDNLNYGIGIQESNFLGLGQKVGFYYGHNEFRDMWQAEYSDPHFLFRYNRLDFLYSYNTDGYLASWQMYVPFLSRSVNQWGYTLAGLKNKRFAYYYGSGDLPRGSVARFSTYLLTTPPIHVYEIQSAAAEGGDFVQSSADEASAKNNTDVVLNGEKAEKLKAFKSGILTKDTLEYNGEETVRLLKVEDFIEDSLSFRFSRSFGGTQRKFYLGATYDYHRETAEEGRLYRYLFTHDDLIYVIDSAAAWDLWLPKRKDSRLGAYVMYSNIRYEKVKNLHNAKWTEDVDKGFSLKAQLSKNYEQLGSDNNDIRLDFWTNLYLGRGWNHLTLQTQMYYYLDHGERRDFYGKVNGEYIFHPNNSFSTALRGLVDLYDDARLGYQLSLGGSDGFVGFPTGYYTGQARVYGSLEQRYFADFEIATLVPVFVAFASVGETAWKLDDINRKDMIYVLGFGARFIQTKSISRLVNKLDVSFPMNGERKGMPHFSITTAYTL